MKKTVLDLFPYFDNSISSKYHQATKIFIFQKPKKDENGNWPTEWVDINYKGYPRLLKIPLPKANIPNKITLFKSLINRQSKRDLKKKEMPLKDLSALLYLTAGLRNINKQDSGNRFYPSAGARYPLEVYPLVLNVAGLKQGVYHYHLKTHSLELLISEENIKEKILSNFNQDWIKDASVIFAISAIFWRAEVKYGDRSYRNTLMEAGTLTQNFYLTTNALNLKCCSIGGFIDNGLHNLIDLDGEEEAVITTIAISN